MPPPPRAYRVPTPPDPLPSASASTSDFQPLPHPSPRFPLNVPLAATGSPDSSSTPITNEPTGPRARLRSLERLRETLNERVEHLSQALEQIRVQATEIGTLPREERPRDTPAVDATRSSEIFSSLIHEITPSAPILNSSPSSSALSPSRIAPSNRRRSNQVSEHTPYVPSFGTGLRSDFPNRPISIAELDLLLDRAAQTISTPSSTLITMPNAARGPTTGTAMTRPTERTSYVPHPPTDSVSAVSTRARREALQEIRNEIRRTTPLSRTERTRQAAREIRELASALTTRGTIVEERIENSAERTRRPDHGQLRGWTEDRPASEEPPAGNPHVQTTTANNLALTADDMHDPLGQVSLRRRTSPRQMYGPKCPHPRRQGMTPTNLEISRNHQPIIVRSIITPSSPGSTVTHLNHSRSVTPSSEIGEDSTSADSAPSSPVAVPAPRLQHAPSHFRVLTGDDWNHIPVPREATREEWRRTMSLNYDPPHLIQPTWQGAYPLVISSGSDEMPVEHALLVPAGARGAEAVPGPSNLSSGVPSSRESPVVDPDGEVYNGYGTRTSPNETRATQGPSAEWNQVLDILHETPRTRAGATPSFPSFPTIQNGSAPTQGNGPAAPLRSTIPQPSRAPHARARADPSPDVYVSYDQIPSRHRSGANGQVASTQSLQRWSESYTAPGMDLESRLRRVEAGVAAYSGEIREARNSVRALQAYTESLRDTFVETRDSIGDIRWALEPIRNVGLSMERGIAIERANRLGRGAQGSADETRTSEPVEAVGLIEPVDARILISQIESNRQDAPRSTALDSARSEAVGEPAILEGNGEASSTPLLRFPTVSVSASDPASSSAATVGSSGLDPEDEDKDTVNTERTGSDDLNRLQNPGRAEAVANDIDDNAGMNAHLWPNPVRTRRSLRPYVSILDLP